MGTRWIFFANLAEKKKYCPAKMELGVAIIKMKYLRINEPNYHRTVIVELCTKTASDQLLHTPEKIQEGKILATIDSGDHVFSANAQTYWAFRHCRVAADKGIVCTGTCCQWDITVGPASHRYSN